MGVISLPVFHSWTFALDPTGEQQKLLAHDYTQHARVLAGAGDGQKFGRRRVHGTPSSTRSRTTTEALDVHQVGDDRTCGEDRRGAELRTGISKIPNDPACYIHLARILATCPDGKHRNGGQALELATKACKLSDWKDRHALECLAAAHAESGDFAEAVKWQKKVIETPLESYMKSFEESTRTKQRERLTLYEEKKPCRLKD